MNLDDTQKRQVARWIEEGLKLSDIQKRLETDMNIRMTYMDLRFLVDDLKVMPKDPEPDPEANPESEPEPEPEPHTSEHSRAASPLDGPAPSGAAGRGKVSVTVDSLARPGAVVSGSVTFSDGQSAMWYLDQMGRLGLAPQQQGYKPTEADVQSFQIELQNQLRTRGF